MVPSFSFEYWGLVGLFISWFSLRLFIGCLFLFCFPFDCPRDSYLLF